MESDSQCLSDPRIWHGVDAHWRMSELPDLQGASFEPARPRTAAAHSRPSLLFCRRRGMETNCRKLVSACVQLGKVASPSRSPDGRLRHARAAEGHRARSEIAARGAASRGRPGQEGNKAPGAGGLSCARVVDREGRVPKSPSYSSLPEPLTAGVARREDAPCAGWPEDRRDRVPSAFPSNWVFALCPSFSSVFPHPSLPRIPQCPLLPAAAGDPSLPARGAGARRPGVQPAAVECLFSKDSEIKKVEFTDSPESRKEAASSKLFPRQHPGANGKAGSEVQAARRAPASGPLGLARRTQASAPDGRSCSLNLNAWPLGGTGSSRPRDVNSFPQIILHP